MIIIMIIATMIMIIIIINDYNHDHDDVCGGGHPGGGVMGAPGRIAAEAAARKILNKKWTFE